MKCKKFISLIVSGALVGALSVTPATAYAAADFTSYIPTTASSTSGLLTGAATRAAMPSIEILGLASVEESGQSVDMTTDSSGKYLNIYNWSQPKYLLVASSLNSELSPYLANLAIGQGTMAVYNESRDGGNGPNAALSTTDQTDKDVLALADLVVGDGDGADPDAVAYSFSNYSELVATMYAIAEAADNLLEQPAYSNVSLRYDDVFDSATEIAELYEQYTMGTIGYVQRAIDNGQVTKGTVALVVDAWQDDDDNWVFRLMTEDEATTADGTASSNRYLETTVYTGIELNNSNDNNDSDNDNDSDSDSDSDSYSDKYLTLANNYADILGTVTDSETGDPITLATESDLKSSSLDLIMVGGQQSSSNYNKIMEGLVDSELLYKTYFVENNSSAGSQYGVVMNSVENAQNVGRILGCLYPTIIDQQSWLAYYYENFYHIKSDLLLTAMNNALDGVRCWNATDTTTIERAVLWDLTEAYSTNVPCSKVASTIAAGLTYLCNNTEYVSPAPSN